jgi:rhamnosyltransferase subunit B
MTMRSALFPSWFAAPQPDWPRGVRQFGFPIASNSRPLSDCLENFLASGEPPVVWTHGSANFDIEDFQSWALEVSRNLNLRCLLISLDPPATMSDTALHVGHARFEDLFPRCKAVVHHGGIGTTAKCIAAGVPQVRSRKSAVLLSDEHFAAGRNSAAASHVRDHFSSLQ